MDGKSIPVEESFAAWRKDRAYREAYAALEEEFRRAARIICEREVTTPPAGR